MDNIKGESDTLRNSQAETCRKAVENTQGGGTTTNGGR